MTLSMLVGWVAAPGYTGATMVRRQKLDTAMRNNAQQVRLACPFARTLLFVGPAWHAPVLWKIAAGERRFADLCRALPTISRPSLARVLQRLRRAEIVEPHPQGGYQVSTRGVTLLPLLREMQAWGEEHTATETGWTTGG